MEDGRDVIWEDRIRYVGVNESHYSLPSEIFQMSSLMYTSASNWGWDLGSARMALGLLLKAIPVTGLHGSNRAKCSSLRMRSSNQYCGRLRRDSQRRRQLMWGPLWLRETGPISGYWSSQHFFIHTQVLQKVHRNMELKCVYFFIICISYEHFEDPSYIKSQLFFLYSAFSQLFSHTLLSTCYKQY